MNVRKRGLALLMCICMIFTLLPFSVFAEDAENGNRGGAEGTAQQSVVYGTYDESGTTWKQVNGMTAVGEPYTSATGADVTYSKTATPVEGQNDTYNITLKIESKTSSTAPGASAVVLVIDSSGSMKDGRLTNAKNVAKSFIDSYGTSGSDRYLAVVNFDTYANAFEFGRDKTSWLDVSNGTNRQTAKNRFDNLSAGGGTNLEQGLTKAKDLLNNNTVKSIAKENKFVIVLTDGEPTFYSAEKNGNLITGYYPKGDGNSCDQDTYDATVTAATELKSSANSVYTVCYGAQNEIIDCTKETVSNFLKTKIATSAALAHVASDGNESLKKAFEEIYESIEQGLSSGFTVTDPMGKYIQLDKSSIKDATAKVNGNTITWTPTTGEVSEENGVKTYTYTLTYTVKLDTAANGFVDNKYYATNGVTTLVFNDGGTNKTCYFNVPGVKGESPKCTVTYNKGDHGNLAGQDTDGNVATSVKLGSATPKAPDVTPDNGWYFTGWDKDIAPTVTEDVTYTAQYAEKKTITVTAKSDTAEYNGSERLVKGFETLEFAIDGETYTVSGLTASASGIDANDYVSKVEGTAVVKDSSGKDVTERFTVNTVDGKLTITPKTVTLTGESAKRTYTGQEIELTGITPDGLLVGHNASNLTYSARGINVGGPYNGKFNVEAKDVRIIDAENNDVSENYNVMLVPGELTIVKADTVIVKITGKTDTKVYNGSQQTFTGYDVVIENNPNNAYKETDFSLKTGADATASGINVGKYTMGLTADSFVNNNTNFDVTFVVEDGSLTITKRPLTIEGESSTNTITYDGQTHSFTGWNPVAPTDDTGLVSGHEVSGISYLLTGKDAGSYKGVFTGTAKVMAGDIDVTGNYDIEYAPGEMLIEPAEKIVIKITGNTATETYDGTEKSVTGYTTDVKDSSITVKLKEGKAAIAKGTNVDTYYMGLTADDFTATSINYMEIAIEVTDGYLTIKERPYHPNPPITDKITVEITGNSDSVVYDGTEHSVKDYTVKISDSRYTEKDFTFSGKALASGINAGTYEMGLKADQFKNTNARFTNVEFIIKADGVLTITQRPLTITAGSAEGIAPVTCDKYTVEGLATGDKVDSVKITGIQSEPGESPNVASDAVIKNAKGEDVTANYKITYVDGVLKAIEVLNKEIHFNYVIGYTDGTIRPNNDISRAEVATIFFRLLTDEAREQYTTTAGNFTDVKAGMWCNRAIATLTNMGIIKGYTDGSFQPNKSITRAELATIIARFAKLDVNTKTFSDINGHWAQKNIELAAGNGWINGYEDGTFRPNNNITRAETFAMINRVLDRQTESVSDLLPTSEMNMWSDNLNENAWYYKDVQEATNYHKCDRVGDSVYEKWTEKVPDIDWASYQI